MLSVVQHVITIDIRCIRCMVCGDEDIINKKTGEKLGGRTKIIERRFLKIAKKLKNVKDDNNVDQEKRERGQASLRKVSLSTEPFLL